jgi:hypothetical protein
MTPDACLDEASAAAAAAREFDTLAKRYPTFAQEYHALAARKRLLAMRWLDRGIAEEEYAKSQLRLGAIPCLDISSTRR